MESAGGRRRRDLAALAVLAVTLLSGCAGAGQQPSPATAVSRAPSATSRQSAAAHDSAVQGSPAQGTAASDASAQDTTAQDTTAQDTTARDTTAHAAQDERQGALQALMNQRASAVLAKDRRRFAATLDDPGSGSGLRQLELFDNLVRLPLGSFAYGAPDPEPALSREQAAQLGPQAWVARIRGRYTLRGYDHGPRFFETHVTAVRRDGGWRVADADRGSQSQLWDLPDLRVAAGASTLVVASGRVGRLDGYVTLGDQAVARVGRVWTQPWGRRVVIVVPASAQEMASQLGQQASSVEQVAAVTDGSFGADGRAGADRIVVNPQAFSRLQPTGRRVVITHETTHVAIRASTTRPVPLWLSEGMADYVGYGVAGLPRARVAAALLSQVRAGDGPASLPTEADFDPARTTIAPSYNAAWLAVCRVVDRYGEGNLVRFYARAASGEAAGPGRGTAEDRTRAAMAAVLGVTEEQLTADWLGYLRGLAAS